AHAPDSSPPPWECCLDPMGRDDRILRGRYLVEALIAAPSADPDRRPRSGGRARGGCREEAVGPGSTGGRAGPEGQDHVSEPGRRYPSRTTWPTRCTGSGSGGGRVERGGAEPGRKDHRRVRLFVERAQADAGDVGSYIPVSVDPASNPFPGSGPDERLIQLQELDLSIDRLNARREMLEGQEDIRAASQRAAEAETRLGELKLDVDRVAREQLRLESDIDSMERKIEAERKRLYDGSVANAKELQSIEAEI